MLYNNNCSKQNIVIDAKLLIKYPVPSFCLPDFEQLETNKAAQKAVGELDTVLEWLEGLDQRALT